MLLSFLAALEDGVSFEDQATRKRFRGSTKRGEVSGRVGLPSLLSLLQVDMSGRLRSQGTDEDSEELIAVRRHTEASLFNQLLRHLDAGGAITKVTSPDDLSTIEFGSLVEVGGEIVGNPLQHLLVMSLRILSVAGLDVQSVAQGKLRQKELAIAQKAGLDQDAIDGFSTMLAIGVEVINAPIRDVVLETGSDLKAVLTMSSEFITAEAEEQLEGSRFRVVGKVTHVVREQTDEPVNLARRTDLGLLEEAQVDKLLRDVRQAVESPLKIRATEPVVRSPALQILPLAIYV